MPTIVPTQNGASLVAALMAQHDTDVIGHAMTEPVSTIVQKRCTQALVAAHVTTYYGAKGEHGTERGQALANSLATLSIAEPLRDRQRVPHQVSRER